MQKLFLFDLDGTVLKVHTPKMISIVDKSLIDNGLVKKTKIEKKFSGRTDKDIFYSYLEPEIHHLYEPLKKRYIDLMLTDLTSQDVDLIDGVTMVCDWITTNQLHYGVLTGNYELSGKKKIDCSRFPLSVQFGIFGDNHESRTELASHALPLSRSAFNYHFEPKDIVIIGDTPKDIICAKENGYTSVAVSTGNYTTAQLDSYQPDYCISNLDQMPFLFNS